MATYVLVHGAWGGAHGFRHVRRLLQDAGHQVTTPSLTGIGERAHLASPQVGLGTHVQDVVNHLLYEDLRDVVLLGFSYGGMVVTGALEHVAERIRHLVFLDAFVPEDGDTAFGLLGLDPPPPMSLGQPWLVPPADRDFDDPDEGRWSQARRTPQPAGCFSEPVRLSRPLEHHPFGLSYVKATGDPPDAPGNAAFLAAAERARSSQRWQYHEIATNHMVASNRPADLAALLLTLA
jgi:pimeloyl-ACP methyl ester carboxylesterase